MHIMNFSDTIWLEKYVSQDVYGKCTYEVKREVSANIDYVLKNIVDFRGNTIMTSAWIALPPETDIGLSDRVTLPDGSNPKIGSISPIQDKRRGQTHYIEVYVSRQRPGEGSL